MEENDQNKSQAEPAANDGRPDINAQPAVREDQLKGNPPQVRKDVVKVDQGPQENRDARQNQVAERTGEPNPPAVPTDRPAAGAEISHSDNVVGDEKAKTDQNQAADKEPLHKIDQHTGEGTQFPVGSPMAVVPPSDKQNL